MDETDQYKVMFNKKRWKISETGAHFILSEIIPENVRLKTIHILYDHEVTMREKM